MKIPALSPSTFRMWIIRRNMAVIQSHPASREEEIEIKVIRIFIALGLMLLAVLLLAFMHVPFPLLIVGFIIAAPVVSLFILGYRSPPPED